jgi:two-component system response regulator RegA
MAIPVDKRVRALVVEDDADLLQAIGREVERSLDASVRVAASLADGIASMRAHKPHLIITDVYLSDGRCEDLVAEALLHRPLPAIVAISGRASPEEAFALGALGIRSYLAKPLSLSGLRQVLARVLESSPPVVAIIAGQVGRVSIEVMKRDVRTTMLTQALALTAGNRTECARILGITRQAVQHMIRELEIDTEQYNLEHAKD